MNKNLLAPYMFAAEVFSQVSSGKKYTLPDIPQKEVTPRKKKLRKLKKKEEKLAKEIKRAAAKKAHALLIERRRRAKFEKKYKILRD